jgi:hypothetical protein
MQLSGKNLSYTSKVYRTAANTRTSIFSGFEFFLLSSRPCQPHTKGNTIKGDLRMLKTILRVVAVMIIGLICGVIGLILGALIGGNYAQQFVFNGVQGYEATGQIGLILGAVTGLILGWRLLIKRKSSSLPG